MQGVVQTKAEPAEDNRKTIELTPKGVKTVTPRPVQRMIQRDVDPAASSVPSAETTSKQRSPTAKRRQDQGEADQLEHLAAAIYAIVRQRIAIEQERHGRGYSGRLPW